MRFLSLALALCGGAAALINRRAENTTNAAPVAKSFIVEYEPGQANRRDGLASAEGVKIVRFFNSPIFSGANIETDSYSISRLENIPGVLRVWPNERVYLNPAELEVLDGLPTNFNYTTHSVTGVSKLHEAGIYGEGAKVGIVDSGTWYGHTALGGGFGPGFKVAGGYDFVGDGDWPSGDKQPDDDPLDHFGHGTHVAGIVAAKADTWTGVAPEATIYSYKVFPGATDYTDTATLIDAFLRAYDDDHRLAWAEVASRLVDEGILVTIAAGNDGDHGPFYGSTGSSGTNVIAIASVDTEVFPEFPFGANFTVDGVTSITTFGYFPSTFYFPSAVVGWPIVPLSFNTSDPAEACEPYPEGTQNLTGKIPIVRRGTCPFATKQCHLAALGAEYMLFYNNEAPLIQPGTTDDSTLIALVIAEIGEAIIDAVKKNGTVTADFSVNPENPIGYANPFANKPDTFTQWGPSFDLDLKPDIAAPGGNIFSTYLNGEYAIMSGTSMATPYVAGIAALYVGATGGRTVHGKAFAYSLRRRIISSGAALLWFDGTDQDYGFTASVAQVRNGLVNGFKVVNYTTDVEYEKFNLNDTAHFKGSHPVTVTNNGDRDVSYSFKTKSAAGSRRVKKFDELEPIDLPVEVNLPEDFTLKAGESKDVSIDFVNPQGSGWNSSGLPLYSGKVILSSSAGEQLSFPYLGLGADLKAELSDVYYPGYPFLNSGPQNKDISVKSSYTFNVTRFYQDYPKIYTQVIWGSKQVRWDIYEAGWNESQWSYPPVEGENGYIGPAASWNGDGANFDDRFYDPNNTFTYPLTDTLRGGGDRTWFGKLGNGSQIANGNYTWRFATLRPFGDPTVSEDWDIWKTPQITVLGHY
ncbi:subtilisin-like protein [Daldinia caldariorum]|uniref:subtilisin-like protein n=1 Tax=Daldinia caldariorum TaxID=326644 RepID=UPI002007F9F1|nr:subtilisin-like protein [Daldinia caldariorum]KAI1466675.1 subtilisin-like protein [Daldinia caldariorum]